MCTYWRRPMVVQLSIIWATTMIPALKHSRITTVMTVMMVKVAKMKTRPLPLSVLLLASQETKTTFKGCKPRSRRASGTSTRARSSAAWTTRVRCSRLTARMATADTTTTGTARVLRPITSCKRRRITLRKRKPKDRLPWLPPKPRKPRTRRFRRPRRKNKRRLTKPRSRPRRSLKSKTRKTAVAVLPRTRSR